MKLQDWQKEQNLSDVQLAELLDIDRTYIYRLNKGERRASPYLALKIEQLTQGKVSRIEVLYP